ncbi:MAG: putative glycoside hydrolase [Candidatus Tenebribacter davisii]|nr:putative glycoside hydrolase [Candidatus Tenebribacter davisii]
MKHKYILLIIIIVIISCSGRKSEEIQNKIVPEMKKNEIVKTEVHQEKDKIEKEQIKKKIPKKIQYKKFTKGIYLTAYTINMPKFHTILDSAETAGMNTLIFDLKNMNGHIFLRMPQKGFLSDENMKPIVNINRVVKTVHSRNMRAVARLVMFHDQVTAQKDSTLRPQNINGGSWQESKRKKPAWLDPSNQEVQTTLLNIIENVAKNGVDEIQMDYVRFPTQGKISDAVFSFQMEDSLRAMKDSTYIYRGKSDIIKEFVKKAKGICDKYNVTLSADVFAIVAWQRNADIKATGQDIKRMTHDLDAIHPMIYSSHFAKDFGYRENVQNEPYHIVYKGSVLTKNYAMKNCRVIPYLQSNSWKVNYNYNYIAAQIQAVIDSGSDGYILWNASNRYFQTLRWIREFENTD